MNYNYVKIIDESDIRLPGTKERLRPDSIYIKYKIGTTTVLVLETRIVVTLRND